MRVVIVNMRSAKGSYPSHRIYYFRTFLDDKCPMEREKGLVFGLVSLEKTNECGYSALIGATA
jgi:hypothetical protein